MRQKKSGGSTVNQSCMQSRCRCKLPMVVIAALLTSQVVLAAVDDLVFGYARAIGDSSWDFTEDVAVDGAGNAYCIGTFQGTVDFDSGPADFTLTSAGNLDIYICKFDVSGVFQWARAMGGTEGDVPVAIALDSAGDVYLTGYFSDTVDFDPGPGAATHSSAGGSDVFVCKLDTYGNYLWSLSFGGVQPDAGGEIIIEGTENIYITGTFAATVDFDPGAGIANLTSAGGTDCYLLNLDAAGTFKWARAMGGSSADAGVVVRAVSTGNLYVAGTFEGVADFDPGPGSFAMTSAGRADLFVVMLDSAGMFGWARAFRGPDSAEVRGMACDAMGNVYTSGFFRASVDFDPGPGAYTMTSAGNWDAFLCKLDPAGTLDWVRALGGIGDDQGTDLQLSSAGELCWGGIIGSSVDFDIGPGVFSLGMDGESSYSLAIFDSAGMVRSAVAFGEGSSSYSNPHLAVDTNRNLYVAGIYFGVADFDPGPATTTLPVLGFADGFVAKLEPQQLPVANGDVAVTDADQLLFALSAPASITLLANDTDGNTGANLTVSTFDATSALGALVSVNPDGTFVYDPTGVAAFQALAPGDSLVDTFTYTLSDGLDSAVGSVSVTVNGKGTGLPVANGWALSAVIIVLALAGSVALRREDGSVHRALFR